MQEISGVSVADELTLLFELYEVYINVTNAQESFDEFLFYCEMLLADFDDIDKYLVNAKDLFQNLAELKEIDNYFDYLDEIQLNAIKQFWEAFSESRPSPEKESFSKLWNVLYRIYTEFHALLKQKGLASEGSAYRQAIDLLENTMKEAPGKEVWFVGFNALNTCEKRLFNYLKEQGKASFFWDFDDYYLKKDFHEAGFFLRELVVKFPKPMGFNHESNLTGSDKKIEIIDITTHTGQAKLIPEILGKLPPTWIHDPVKTAIALADETLLMPVLNTLPDNIGEVNISMGYPLINTSIYSLIGVLMDLQKNKRSSKKGYEQFYHKDILRVLQSGLLSEFKTPETEKLIEEITKFNKIYVPYTELNLGEEFFQLLFSTGIHARNFVPYLIGILKKVPSLLSSNHSQIFLIEGEAAFRLLTRLQRINDILAETHISFSFKSLVRLIGKVLQGVTVPFSGEPLSGMQVMGILETRTLDFDNLVILSMNEGVFPKSGHVPSFVPYTLRKAFNMPTVEHQDAIFAYYFYRLLQRAKNITLVYTSSVQDTKSGEPSRFLQQLIYEPAFQATTQTIGYPINPIAIKKIEVKKSKSTQQTLLDRFSAESGKLLSPSAINAYLNCQILFYYRYIAGLKEPERVLEEVEANTLGSILHKVMEELYAIKGKTQLTEADLKGILKDKKKIKQAVTQAFWTEYLSPDKPFPGEENVEISGKNILVRAVIEKYAETIIAYDIQHAPFNVIGLEVEHARVFTLKNGLQVSIGGIIDRLDAYNGKTRIIDYKTGRSKKTFPDVEELFFGESSKRNVAAFQTLLYALVIAEKGYAPIEPGLYFVRDMQSSGYSYQLEMGGRNKVKIENAADVLEHFESLLLATLNDIFSTNGKFVQTQDEKFCSYCHFAPLCSK
jgi:hypothetical protein